jgi:hypothetical protein
MATYRDIRTRLASLEDVRSIEWNHQNTNGGTVMEATITFQNGHKQK